MAKRLGLLYITQEALGRALGLPEGVRIETYCRDDGPMLMDGFGFRISGTDPRIPECQEGAYPKMIQLELFHGDTSDETEENFESATIRSPRVPVTLG